VNNFASSQYFTVNSAVPKNLALTQIANGFRITWDNVLGATQYKVYWGNDSSVSETNYAGILTTGSTPYDHTNLTSGAAYYYRIMACNDAGCSSLSSAEFDLFSALQSSQPLWVPVHRLYKSADKDHFYTTNPGERDTAIKPGPAGDYTYEKIEFYLSDRPFTGGIPLYRYYYGADKKHYYTTITSSAKAGYTEGPGVVGYVYPNPTEGMVPLYHLEGPTGDHFYTISKFERDNAVQNHNFFDWGPQCYVSPSVVSNNRPQGNFAGIGMYNGAFSVPFMDISLSGAGPALNLTRYYNSYNFFELPFGGGWSHSLYSYAIEDIDGNVTIKWGNGTEDFFKNDGSDNFSGILGTFSKLIKLNNDEYELTSKDLTIYKFARVSVNNALGAAFIPDLPLIRIKDKFNNQVVISTNAVNGRIERASRMVDGITTAQSLTFNYNDNNRLSSIVDTSISPNRTIIYGYNSDGYLSSVQDARGNVTRYEYNTDGFLSSITYPEGNTTIIVYDPFQRVKGYTAGGITLSFDYSETDGTTVKNGSTTIANFIHDQKYRAEKITFSGDVNDFIKPEYFDDNLLNLQEKVKDRNGNTSAFSYDANGNVLTVKNDLNETTTFTYDISNNTLTSVTDPRGNTTQFVYDADTKKELRSIRKPLGGTTNYTYYANGLVKTITDPTGNTVTYSYDVNGNIIKIYDNALSASVDFSNDGAGRRKTQTDRQRPTPQLTTWEYDNNDNIISVQVNAHPAVFFGYDRNNRLDSVVDQMRQETAYTYNLTNLLETQTSPDHKQWQYAYNSLGKLSSISLPDGKGITYTYDTSNRLRSVHNNGVEKLEYTYDKNGNVLSLQADNNRTTSFVYNAANRVTSITGPFGNTIGYGYDPAGNRDRITYPGAKEVYYTYDADNRLKTVQDWLGDAATVYNYDNAGILQSIRNANGTTVMFGYDEASRLTSLANRNAGGSSFADYLINEMDNIGNPLSIARNEPQVPPIPTAETISYAYNNASQIQSAGSITYTHDGLGNLSGTSNGKSFAFDYANRLMSAAVGSDTFSFQYDGFGNRISRTRNGIQTRYILDLNAEMSNVLAETDSNGVIQNYYIHGLGLISRIDQSGQRFTYHYDTAGNTVAVTNEGNEIVESYTYDEFGSVLSSAGGGTNPFLYVGQFGVMDDGNGLLYMRARYYDTETGRFLSRDPLGFGGGDLNLYAYVGGNPMTGIDPSGKATMTFKEFGDNLKQWSKESSIDLGVSYLVEGGSNITGILVNLGGETIKILNKDLGQILSGNFSILSSMLSLANFPSFVMTVFTYEIKEQIWPGFHARQVRETAHSNAMYLNKYLELQLNLQKGNKINNYLCSSKFYRWASRTLFIRNFVGRCE
jgi:RHS repeat-associated protein